MYISVNSKSICFSIAYPEQVIHSALSGGKHEYFATGADIYTKPVQFQTPVLTTIPGDCEIDVEKASDIPAWKTPSCHILVKPLINGKESGYMILDTGASGLVIEKPIADELNLEAFGELFVSGMAGKVLLNSVSLILRFLSFFCRFLLVLEKQNR